MNGGPIKPMRISGGDCVLSWPTTREKSRNLDASLLVGQLSSMFRDPFIAYRAKLRTTRLSSSPNERDGTCGNRDDDS